MNSFFDIKSVVIVGASLEEGKIGNTLLKNIGKFCSIKYGVNPKRGEFKEGFICGDNKIVIHKTISDLPTVPDIAIFAIPSKFIIKSLEEAGKKGIKKAIVISAGFKEIGNIELENELISISNKYGILLLGPNCLGYADVNNNLNLSFGTKDIDSGNIAMISQSGAMAVALTDWALLTKIGFSKMISMGNKAGLNECDLLEELENDEETKVIAIYLESIEQGKRFIEITKKISKKKPIVLIKSGVSKKGSNAASSHTGALVSEKIVLDTAFTQSGIHFTSSLENFFLFSEIFSHTLDKKIPEELVVITNAGGPGVMVTDHIEFNNLKFAEFNSKEKEILKTGLPNSASVSNPVDIIGDATSKTYKQILNNLIKTDKKVSILLLLTAQSITDVEKIAEIIVDFQNKYKDQFIMVSFMGGKGVLEGRNILRKAGVLEYDYPRKAIASFSKLLKQKRWEKQKDFKQKELSIDIENIKKIKTELKKQNGLCSSVLVGKIFDLYGVNYSKDILVESKNEVGKAFEKLKTKNVIARIASPDIAHKTDVGGVVLNIKTKQEAVEAYNTILKNISTNIPEARIDGVIFSKMGKNLSNREIFVGFKKDLSFGDILIVGMGGLYVNIYEDVTRRVGIMCKKEILKMLSELKGYKILEGYRGEKSVDFDLLIDTIYRIQFIFRDFEEIKEIDINPMFSNDEECNVADAKFYL